MTKQRASQLQPEVLAKIQQLFDMRPDALAKSRCDPKLYICAGRDYLKALEGYELLISPGVNVQIAAGSLGKKLSTLHTWLYGKPPEFDRHLTQTLSGQVNFKGLKLEMTPDRVLDIARQALAENKGDPSAYQSWYVLVDEQKVSTKWLVSQLTGLPISSFHSSSARKILVDLGVKVRYL